MAQIQSEVIAKLSLAWTDSHGPGQAYMHGDGGEAPVQGGEKHQPPQEASIHTTLQPPGPYCSCYCCSTDLSSCASPNTGICCYSHRMLPLLTSTATITNIRDTEALKCPAHTTHIDITLRENHQEGDGKDAILQSLSTLMLLWTRDTIGQVRVMCRSRIFTPAPTQPIMTANLLCPTCETATPDLSR